MKTYKQLEVKQKTFGILNIESLGDFTINQVIAMTNNHGRIMLGKMLRKNTDKYKSVKILIKVEK
jgi:hypothetical protein